MATNVYIRGLSGRGFRVKNSAGVLKTVKFVKDANAGAAFNNVQVDIDDPATQAVLSRERDNFIRVASATANTTTIIGLDRRGFRLTSGGTTSRVKAGNGAVTTVDLGDDRVARTLKREKRNWARSASISTLAVRGLTEAQASFSASTRSSATAILTTTGVNVSDNDTVTINDVTYRFKNTLAAANDVKIGADSNASLDNLVKAVNLSGVVGTDYFAGTVAPTNVTAGARSGTGAAATVTFTAAQGDTGNTYASTEVAATLAFSNGAAFTGGNWVDSVRKSATTTLDPRVSSVRNQLQRHYRSWVESA